MLSMDEANPPCTPSIPGVEREREKSAVTLPQNVSDRLLTDSSHSGGREGEGLAAWMKEDTHICSPKSKRRP